MKKILVVALLLLALGGYFFWHYRENALDHKNEASQLLVQGQTIQEAMQEYVSKFREPVASLDQLYKADLLINNINPDRGVFAGVPSSWQITAVYFPTSGHIYNVLALEGVKKEIIEEIRQIRRIPVAPVLAAQKSSDGTALSLTALKVEYKTGETTLTYTYDDHLSRNGSIPGDLDEFTSGAANYFYQNRYLIPEDEEEYVVKDTVAGLNRQLQAGETNPNVQFSLQGSPIENPYAADESVASIFIPSSLTLSRPYGEEPYPHISGTPDSALQEYGVLPALSAAKSDRGSIFIYLR